MLSVLASMREEALRSPREPITSAGGGGEAEDPPQLPEDAIPAQIRNSQRGVPISCGPLGLPQLCHPPGDWERGVPSPVRQIRGGAGRSARTPLPPRKLTAEHEGQGQGDRQGPKEAARIAEGCCGDPSGSLKARSCC